MARPLAGRAMRTAKGVAVKFATSPRPPPHCGARYARLHWTLIHQPVIPPASHCRSSPTGSWLLSFGSSDPLAQADESSGAHDTHASGPSGVAPSSAACAAVDCSLTSCTQPISPATTAQSAARVLGCTSRPGQGRRRRSALQASPTPSAYADGGATEPGFVAGV